MKPLISTLLLAFSIGFAGCQKSDAPAGSSANPGSGATASAKPLVIGVAFETLQTEYWVAGFEAIRADLRKRGYTMLEAVSDSDTNRQLEQVKNFITRKVDGIIFVPKDAKSCLPIIKAANAANIPIVLFNRPADKSDAKSVAVVADNFALTKETVDFLVAEAKKTGRKHKAALLVGDLGDMNAIGRRDGFDAAIKGNESIVEVVARIPTEWNQEKAQAGIVNALQANPDISLIFTSSDFLFPSIVSALKSAGKYHKIGTPEHVILGGFDGDATAYQMLKDGYLDATGVQDVYFEAHQCVQAILDLRAGKSLPELIRDPGFVIHQGNLKEKSAQMWGAQKR
jgi:inositol transport system substrate-binding protein